MLRRLIISFMVLSAATLVTALPSSAATLHDLLVDLVKNHDRIQVATYRTNAATHEVGQSRSAFLPSLDLSLDTGQESIDRDAGSDTDSWRYRTTIRATQLLYDFGKTTSDVHRALALEERAKANQKLARQDVLLEGTTAYLRIIRARERYALSRKSVTSIRKQVNIEERLRKKGAGLSSDVLQAQAQLAGTESVAATYEGELLAAKNRFTNLFHMLPDQQTIDTMKIPDSLSRFPATLEIALKSGFSDSALLRIARREVDLAGKEVEVQKKTLWPRLELFAEADHRQDDDGSVGDRTDLAAGIKLTANLFRGHADTEKIAAAQNRLHAAKKNLAFVRRQVEEQIRNAWDAWETSGKRTQLLYRQADNLNRFLELARKERAMGTRSLLDVLNAEVSALSAQSNAVAAEIDRTIQACRLLHAMGILTVKTFQE